MTAGRCALTVAVGADSFGPVNPVVPLSALLCAACVQKPPHATVTVQAGSAPAGHAVLVVPTACISNAGVWLCQPSTWVSPESTMQPPASFGEVIDPALRLKLEFAGFTLAEAGALRLGTADRVEVNGESRVTEPTEGPRTVAELGFDDARAVARSLSLTSVLVPQLTIRPAGIGTHSGELTVALVDVATNQPLWTVSCKETMYNVYETPNRLANCVGNGVLAVLAPENLIGRAL
jgi:hypothetical protein